MQNIVRINHRWRLLLHLLRERVWVSIEDILPYVPNLKYARRIMRAMIKLGLIKHTQCSMPFQNKGPGKNFYALKNSAARFFDSSVREPKYPTSTQLFHFYITNIFLTGFYVLSKNNPGFNVKTIAEKELRSLSQEFNKTDFSTERICIPDFAINICSQNESLLFLGEVDTETETICNSTSDSATIANKFIGIKKACRMGLLERLSKKFETNFSDYCYLHITTGNINRAEKIIETANAIYQAYPVFVTTFDSFFPLDDRYENLIKRIWYKEKNKPTSILEDV